MSDEDDDGAPRATRALTSRPPPLPTRGSKSAPPLPHRPSVPAPPPLPIDLPPSVEGTSSLEPLVPIGALRRGGPWSDDAAPVEPAPADTGHGGLGGESPSRATAWLRLVQSELADASALRQALRVAMGGGVVVPPTVVVRGELSMVFRQRDRLAATLGALTPWLTFSSDDEGGDGEASLVAALRRAASVLTRVDDAGLGAVFEQQLAALGDALAGSELAIDLGAIDRSVDRALLEGRRYRELRLFGGPHLEASLRIGAETIPVYLPQALSGHLPLLARFPVRGLVEVHHRVDGDQRSDVALRVRALARVVEAADEG